MAGDQSFDVVSDFDRQELRNALDQVRREVGTRFDFKGVPVDLTQQRDDCSSSRRRVSRGGDQGPRSSRRRPAGLSLKIFDWGKVEEAGGNKVRQRSACARADGREREEDHAS
jgi:uncharacterized protein YajQ (UPF0234 family)